MGDSVRYIIIIFFREWGHDAVGGEVGERGFGCLPRGVKAAGGAAVSVVVFQQIPAAFQFFQLGGVSGVECGHGVVPVVECWRVVVGWLLLFRFILHLKSELQGVLRGCGIEVFHQG